MGRDLERSGLLTDLEERKEKSSLTFLCCPYKRSKE